MVSGLNELEELNINWNAVLGIGNMPSTRCCATGTCDRCPKNRGSSKLIIHPMDEMDPKAILKHYGKLR